MEHLHGHMGISLVLELTHLALPGYYGPSRTEAEHPQPRFGEVGEADSLRMQSLHMTFHITVNFITPPWCHVEGN